MLAKDGVNLVRGVRPRNKLAWGSTVLGVQQVTGSNPVAPTTTQASRVGDLRLARKNKSPP
jgi:hypothetical protein